MKLDLAELKKRLQVRTALALTLESGRVVVDLMRRDDAGSHVVKSLVVALRAEAIAADPEKAGQELAVQLAAASITERRCVVCVPAGWALTTSTDVPAVGAEDLRGYLELRAEREFPVAVSDLRLAHCAYVLPDGKQRATLAAIPMKRMEAVERMLAAAGRRAVSISLGLDACVAGETPAAMHFLSNGNHVDVVISAGGGIAAVRSLAGPPPVGGVAFDAAQFSREVRITLGGLPAAVREQVREARFSGAPAASENLCIEIRQHLRRMGIDSRLVPPGDDGTAHPGAAIETAALYLRQQPVAFEFVPPQVNRWQTLFQRFDSRRRRWIAIAAFALVFLPVFTFFVRSWIESSLTSDWDGMHKKVGELEVLQQKIRQFRPWFEPAPQSLQVLEALMGAFPDQGDVWAKSIQIVEGPKVTCSGFARSQAALNSLLDRLRARTDVADVQVQSVRGQNPIQFSFTYKWEARDAK